MFYWLLKSILLGPLLRAIFRPEVSGLERVPAAGPVIMASNHLSFSDSIFLPLVVPRRITFLAKSDYFSGRGVKGWLTAGFFRGVGQVPIDRTGGSASEGALSAGMRVLGAGQVLGIYPEGTRSPDGKLYRGKTGVARMALEANCPVVPVAMIGTDKVQPTGQKIPNLGRVGIVIGQPLDFSRYRDRAEDRTVLRSITDEIMAELQKLSGQEYVDVYASTVKEQFAEAVKQSIAAARQRAQTAATTATANAERARQRVEEATKQTVDDAKARVDALHLPERVEGARARVDEATKHTVEEARSRMGAARARLSGDSSSDSSADLGTDSSSDVRTEQPDEPTDET